MYFLAMTSFLHNKLSHINEMLSSLIQPKQINQTGAFKMDNIFKDEKMCTGIQVLQEWQWLHNESINFEYLGCKMLLQNGQI